MTPPVLELRVALVSADYERLAAFYRDGLGLDPAELWKNADEGAVIFELGRATLEVFDEAHGDTVDEIETGQRLGARIRFALRVPDLDAALSRALAWGATQVHEPVITPWRHYNVRLQAPDGMQITLFQVLDSDTEGD
ncbi:MAG: VOC family protein [Anaerolineae bacterium]|nr:VOC family protein [Anaerolineae bacterium]